MSEQSISADPVAIGVRRLPAVDERLEGRLNGRRVVLATKRANNATVDGRLNVEVWEVYCTGLPGDAFTVNHIGPGIEAIVKQLTELIASAILRPYPLETVEQKQEHEG